MATRVNIALATAIAALSTAAGAVPARGPVYTGYGTEPFWGISIGRGRMVFSGPDQPSTTVAQPRPTAIRGGQRYATSRMTIEVTREGRCNDGMSDHYHRDRVRVWFGRRVGRGLEGCGGPRVPPPELIGTRWRIVGIAGQAVSGDDYFLEFDQERLIGKAGCNQLSGSYQERRPTLTPGAIAATRMACPGPRMAHEQRVLRILSAPLSMNFISANILVLGNHSGQIRLRQED